MRTALMHPVGIWGPCPTKASSASRSSAPEVWSHVDHKRPRSQCRSKYAAAPPECRPPPGGSLSYPHCIRPQELPRHSPDSLGGLNDRNLFPHSIEGWELQNQDAGRAGSFQGHAAWLTSGHLLPPVHVALPPSVRAYILISSVYEDTRPVGSEPTLWLRFTLITSVKAKSPPYGHTLRQEKLGLQHRNFAETQVSP